MSSTIRAIPPSPPEAHIATWQFETSEGAPQLGFKELTPLAMDGTYFSRHQQSSTSSPNLFDRQHNSRHASPHRADAPAPSPMPSQRASPIRPLPRQTHSNYTLHSLNTPPRPQLPLSPQSSPPGSSSPASPEANNSHTPRHTADGASAASSPSSHLFSSAVGRATLGKSGRVIEKLQSEIDRLKRDLLFESTRRHEVERREEAQKDALARLHREVENLERAREVDRGVLGRRERKVEELREEVAREVGRREKAEGECRERVGEAEEVKRRAEQSERRAEERAVQVAVEMKVLQDAYAATEASYRTRTETLERAFGQVLLEKEEEACKVKRLDVVVEQMGQELQRAERTNKLLSDGFKEYKQIKDEELRKFKEKASRDEERDYRVRQEMERVVEEARWLVTLGKRGLDESAMVGA